MQSCERGGGEFYPTSECNHNCGIVAYHATVRLPASNYCWLVASRPLFRCLYHAFTVRYCHFLDEQAIGFSPAAPISSHAKQSRPTSSIAPKTAVRPLLSRLSSFIGHLIMAASRCCAGFARVAARQPSSMASISIGAARSLSSTSAAPRIATATATASRTFINIGLAASSAAAASAASSSGLPASATHQQSRSSSSGTGMLKNLENTTAASRSIFTFDLSILFDDR